MRRLILLGIGFVVGIGFLLYLRSNPNDANTPPAASTTGTPKTNTVSSRPIVQPANGYVGAASCQECHQAQFTSWHASYHRTMTQLVSKETAPDVIHDRVVEVGGQEYRFENDRDEFFVHLREPVAAGEQRRRQLVMMTGSHHMHVFWYRPDFQPTPAILPIVYLKDQERWVPRRSVLLQPPDEPQPSELGSWNQTCSRCHSTHPRQRLQPANRMWDSSARNKSFCTGSKGSLSRNAQNVTCTWPRVLAANPGTNPELRCTTRQIRQQETALEGPDQATFLPDGARRSNKPKISSRFKPPPRAGVPESEKSVSNISRF